MNNVLVNNPFGFELFVSSVFLLIGIKIPTCRKEYSLTKFPSLAADIYSKLYM